MGALCVLGQQAVRHLLSRSGLLPILRLSRTRPSAPGDHLAHDPTLTPQAAPAPSPCRPRAAIQSAELYATAESPGCHRGIIRVVRSSAVPPIEAASSGVELPASFPSDGASSRHLSGHTCRPRTTTRRVGAVPLDDCPRKAAWPYRRSITECPSASPDSRRGRDPVLPPSPEEDSRPHRCPLRHHISDACSQDVLRMYSRCTHGAEGGCFRANQMVFRYWTDLWRCEQKLATEAMLSAATIRPSRSAKMDLAAQAVPAVLARRWVRQVATGWPVGCRSSNKTSPTRLPVTAAVTRLRAMARFPAYPAPMWRPKPPQARDDRPIRRVWAAGEEDEFCEYRIALGVCADFA